MKEDLIEGADTLKRDVLPRHPIGFAFSCSQSGWGDANVAFIQTQWGDATAPRGSTTLVAASLGVCSQPEARWLCFCTSSWTSCGLWDVSCIEDQWSKQWALTRKMDASCVASAPAPDLCQKGV